MFYILHYQTYTLSIELLKILKKFVCFHHKKIIKIIYLLIMNSQTSLQSYFIERITIASKIIKCDLTRILRSILISS